MNWIRRGGGGEAVPSGFEAVSRNLEGLRTNTEDLNQDIRSLGRNLNPRVQGAARDIRPCLNKTERNEIKTQILGECIKSYSMCKQKVRSSAIIFLMPLIATVTELLNNEVRQEMNWFSEAVSVAEAKLWSPTPETQFYTTAIWSLASELSATRPFLSTDRFF
jgi:hypothetical protein